jgi:hypothetical protein
VSVVVHRSADPTLGEVVNSIGYLARVADPGADTNDPAACAKAGLWYDAIDAAMRKIGKEPAGTGHRILHALLRGEQVFAGANPTDPVAKSDAAAQEKALLGSLDTLHDALIMTQPPEKKKHGR